MATETEHKYSIEEYDRWHAAVGLGPEWQASDRRAETIREIEAGVGPGDLSTPPGGSSDGGERP